MAHDTTTITSSGISLLMRRICSAYPGPTTGWSTGDLAGAWAKELRRVGATDADAHAALDAHLERGDAFPPTLGDVLGPARKAARRRAAEARQRARLAAIKERDEQLRGEYER